MQGTGWFIKTSSIIYPSVNDIGDAVLGIEDKRLEKWIESTEIRVCINILVTSRLVVQNVQRIFFRGC